MQTTLLKRLEIIKNAISIEEEDLIFMQVEKLKQLKLDEQTNIIVQLIESQQFENVIQLIEQYKQDHTGISVYEDHAIQGLKLELKILEDSVNHLSDEKLECQRQINHFNSEYMLRLGDLINAILKLQTSSKHLDEEQQKKAQEHYESFQQEQQEQLSELTEKLSANEKKKLKKAYRQASRLCHPDKLSDEIKEQGETIFKSLNEAYRRHDLKRVTQILSDLKNGIGFNVASDKINDKEILQKRVAALRVKVNALENEIQLLKEDEVYQKIQKIENFDEYFNVIKLSLKSELKHLQESHT